jgi:hypothetical protein
MSGQPLTGLDEFAIKLVLAIQEGKEEKHFKFKG